MLERRDGDGPDIAFTGRHRELDRHRVDTRLRDHKEDFAWSNVLSIEERPTRPGQALEPADGRFEREGPDATEGAGTNEDFTSGQSGVTRPEDVEDPAFGDHVGRPGSGLIDPLDLVRGDIGDEPSHPPEVGGRVDLDHCLGHASRPTTPPATPITASRSMTHSEFQPRRRSQSDPNVSASGIIAGSTASRVS